MTERFDAWALVEVMGHRRFAGRVTEQTIAGAGFVRVDVPEQDGRPAFTKVFSPTSIYAITPLSEETARGLVTGCRAEPLESWDIAELRRLRAVSELENGGGEDSSLSPLPPTSEEGDQCVF